MSDIYVTDQNGNRINVSAITKNGSKYPHSGEEFYIQFSYSTNPETIKLHANFAYLQETKSEYKRLTGIGYLYQWKASITGGVEVADDHSLIRGSAVAKIDRETETYPAQDGLQVTRK